MKQIYRAIPLSAPGIGSDVLCIFLLVICQFCVPMALGSSMEAHLSLADSNGPDKIFYDAHLESFQVSSTPLCGWSDPGFLTLGNSTEDATTELTAGFDSAVLLFSTGPFDCQAAFSVPYPDWSGSCAVQDIHTTIIDGQTGQTLATIPSGASRFVSQIPQGCHLIRYNIHDSCGNSHQQDSYCWVVDDVAPAAICTDDLTLSINNNGYGQITAQDVNEGSLDNCSSTVKLEIRRKYSATTNCSTTEGEYSAWSEQVLLHCCDVGQQVVVELRVWDDANGNGVPGDVLTIVLCNGETVQWEDNSNSCWMEVKVEDKIAGQCVAPHDVTISCAELPYDFDPNQTALLADLFGTPQIIDNCGSANWQELPASLDIGSCQQGTITRHFRVNNDEEEGIEGTCQQTISVLPAAQYSIRFPADEAVVCGTPQPDTIAFHEGACDLLAVSVSDELFSAAGDACYKVLRTYQVINWCEYDGESPPVVVGRDEDCDGLAGDEPVWVIVEGTQTFFDANEDPSDTHPLAGSKGTACDGLTNPAGHWLNSTIDRDATRDPITGQADNNLTNDDIRAIDSRGYWRYTQHIKVYDTLAPVITVAPYPVFEVLNSTTCEGQVTIEFSIADACTEEEEINAVFLHKFIEDLDQDGNITQGEFVQDNEITTEISGTPSKYIYTTSLPEGQHALLIKAIDGCGNTSADLILFELVDNKAPSPICINGLAVELSPVEDGTDADADMDPDWGAASVWAEDFIASPVEDCNGPVTYSINRVGEMPNPGYIGLIVTCDDPGTVIVEIHAWDSHGNNDYCETYLLIEDNLELCFPDPEGELAGGIWTEDNLAVDQVAVKLSGPMLAEEQTDVSGAYQFNHLPLGYDYTIQPFSDRLPREGVTTLDIIHIMQHILGERELDSPYKRIAADVDQTTNITTLDIIHIRRLILGIDDAFKHSNSWRFVAKDYQFPNPTNPWEESFPEVISVNNLEATMAGQDFVAIKTGDVHALTSTENSVSVDGRSQNEFLIKTKDTALVAGQRFQVDFKAKDIAHLIGFQATFEWDAEQIEMVGWQEGLIQSSHCGWRFIKNGQLTVSWNRREEIGNEETLFGLQILAKHDVQLGKALRLSSRITPAEAYTNRGQLMVPGLEFEQASSQRTNEFQLYQNVPNPFEGTTRIGFYLPAPGEVSLALFSLSGQQLWRRESFYEKGHHEIIISEKDVAAKGILLYTLTAGKHTATRKLILHE